MLRIIWQRERRHPDNSTSNSKFISQQTRPEWHGLEPSENYAKHSLQHEHEQGFRIQQRQSPSCRE